MNFIAVVKLPQAIYYGCSTLMMFWEDKFTPVNMKSCERCNDRKHRYIKNREQYIIFDISYKIDCMD